MEISTSTTHMHPSVERLLPLIDPKAAQRSQSWHLLRDSMLTCSDFAAALGIDPGKSRQRLFRQKTDQEAVLDRIQMESHHSRFLMREGTQKEELVRKLYESFDPENYPVIDTFGCVRHSDTPGRDPNEPKYTWLGGSPDGVVEKTGRLIEIKNAVTRAMTPGKVPDKYYPQIQGLLEVFNLEECDYIEYHHSYSIGEEATYQVIRVSRDRKWWDENVVKLKQFWAEVLEYKCKIAIQRLYFWRLALRAQKHNNKHIPSSEYCQWPEWKAFIQSKTDLGSPFKKRSINTAPTPRVSYEDFLPPRQTECLV